MERLEKDSIDLSKVNVFKLFYKYFIPTLLGMLGMSAVTAIDGICVGHGVGSDGIAAINIYVPVFTIATGLGLMIGAGCSVVASIHLSRGKVKAARLNVTQAMAIATVATLVPTAAIMSMPEQTALALGSSAHLLPLVVDYLLWFTPALVFQAWEAIALFIIRLDGSPKYAMSCSLVTAVANAVLDGADCVMLSDETAAGNYPIEAVRYMRKITDEAEKLLVNDRKLEEPAADKGIPEFLAYSACLLAEKAHAKAIVSHSLSGASARQVSCRRPPQDIYALTPDPVTIKALNFVWGVHPVFVADPASDPSHLSRAENFIHNCPDFLPNECAVITAGQLKGSTATPRGTNLVKLYWK